MALFRAEETRGLTELKYDYIYELEEGEGT
jgi:hypothetical protein